MVNFTTVACRISSWLKWYKNYKNRLRLAKVIVKNKMSRFLWFSVYIHFFLTCDTYHCILLSFLFRRTGVDTGLFFDRFIAWLIDLIDWLSDWLNIGRSHTKATKRKRENLKGPILEHSHNILQVNIYDMHIELTTKKCSWLKCTPSAARK